MKAKEEAEKKRIAKAKKLAEAKRKRAAKIKADKARKARLEKQRKAKKQSKTQRILNEAAKKSKYDCKAVSISPQEHLAMAHQALGMSPFNAVAAQ